MPVKYANFDFLLAHDDLPVRYAAQAERYFADDPNTALLKLQQFGEALAQQAAASAGVFTLPEIPFIDVLGSPEPRRPASTPSTRPSSPSPSAASSSPKTPTTSPPSSSSNASRLRGRARRCKQDEGD